MSERIFTFPTYDLAAPILGRQDQFLKLLLSIFPCQVVSRGGTTLTLSGADKDVEEFERTLEALVFLAQEGNSITAQQVRLTARFVKEGKIDLLHAMVEDTIAISTRGKAITPKQKVRKSMLIVFAVIPLLLVLDQLELARPIYPWL